VEKNQKDKIFIYKMSKQYVSLTDIWYATLPEIQVLTGDLTNDFFESALETTSKRSIYNDKEKLLMDYQERKENSILYDEIKALHRKRLLDLYYNHKMLDYLTAYFITSPTFYEYYYENSLNRLLNKLFGKDLDLRYAGL